MKGIGHALFGCALLLCAGIDPLASQEPLKTEPEIKTILSGVVLSSATLAPVEGASVTLLFGNGSRGSAVTNSEGEYRIEGDFSHLRSPSSERLQVVAHGFLPETSQFQLACSSVVSVGDEPAFCRRQLDFFLQPATRLFQPSEDVCSVAGRVIDAEGAPLGGAYIELQGFRRGALADESGRFRIDQVPAGLDVAVVQYLGFFPQQKLLLVACSATSVVDDIVVRLVPNAIW